MAYHPKLHVTMEGVNLDIREVELIAEAMAKKMNGSVLQIREMTLNGGGVIHSGCFWEFWIELDPNRYR